ncbi:hypothetical protein PIB30_065266 [Stylosanthes scabra]|uniref:Uncharacterized protein n=1 Tax=Stylosanthes scabra TaxID=79078 RepID=A0ABU6UKS5_9FABA|nr:hypothetical protein [Stylosanthes scabra]
MPRKSRFSKPSKAAPNSEAPTEDNTTSHISVASSQPVSHPESSSGSGARARQSEIRPFRPPRDKAFTALSDSFDNRHPPERCPTHVYRPVVDNTDIEDEDYIPDVDEMASFDDHIDNWSQTTMQKNRTIGKGARKTNRGKSM